MARKPGRPPADEVSEGAAKQIMDVKKITPPDDDSTAQLINRANNLLETTAKSSLLQAAVSSAKKAEIMSRRELEELQNEDTRSPPVASSKLGRGMSADDIRTIAESLPESQREGFIRQAVGMQDAMASPNPMMSAWFQSKVANPAQPAANSPAMSLNDTIQAMMGMMMMQNQMQQQRAAEWREQQEYLEKQHQRRLEELREAKGEVARQEGPGPEVEAMKLQLEFYRDTLKENQAIVKELMAASKASPDGDGELRKEILALTKQNLEDQKAALDAKVRSLESKIGDASRFNLNIHEMVQKANDAGANLRMGDATDLQLANEHELKMRKLEHEVAKDDREFQIRMAEAAAKAESARAQQEAIKMILAEVGGAIVQSKLSSPQPLSKASNNVQSIVGASK